MLYETADDRAKEARIAAGLAEHWSAQAFKMPQLSPIDWYFSRGHSLVAWAELKERRNRRKDAFPTVFLNYSKAQALMFAATAFGCAAVFVIAFQDCVVGIDARLLAGLPLEVRGRTDRGDPNDVEPCVVIPVTMLSRATALVK